MFWPNLHNLQKLKNVKIEILLNTILLHQWDIYLDMLLINQ